MIPIVVVLTVTDSTGSSVAAAALATSNFSASAHATTTSSSVGISLTASATVTSSAEGKVTVEASAAAAGKARATTKTSTSGLEASAASRPNRLTRSEMIDRSGDAWLSHELEVRRGTQCPFYLIALPASKRQIELGTVRPTKSYGKNALSKDVSKPEGEVSVVKAENIRIKDELESAAKGRMLPAIKTSRVTKTIIIDGSDEEEGASFCDEAMGKQHAKGHWSAESKKRDKYVVVEWRDHGVGCGGDGEQERGDRICAFSRERLARAVFPEFIKNTGMSNETLKAHLLHYSSAVADAKPYFVSSLKSMLQSMVKGTESDSMQLLQVKE